MKPKRCLTVKICTSKQNGDRNNNMIGLTHLIKKSNYISS